jgi:hypothetical protein
MCHHLAQRHRGCIDDIWIHRGPGDKQRPQLLPAREEASMTTADALSMHYRIRIRGHLDRKWTGWFDELTLTQNDDGTTDLVGPVLDQSALYGLLARLRDLGATLLLVEQLPASP